MFDKIKSGNSSAGRASVSQTEGREFEPRFPLFITQLFSQWQFYLLPLVLLTDIL